MDSGLLIRPPILTAEQVSRFRKAWDEAYADGKVTRRTAVFCMSPDESPASLDGIPPGNADAAIWMIE